MIKGIPASSGIAAGKAFVAGNKEIFIPKKNLKDIHINDEIQKFTRASEQVKNDICKVKARICEKTKWDIINIFDAHLAIAEDPAFISGITEKIKTEKVNLEYAVDLFLNDVKQTFDAISDDYIKSRYWDIKDIARRIQAVSLRVHTPDVKKAPQGSILIARSMSPADIVSINKKNITGIVTETGNAVSHSSIICKSYNIPLVTGAAGACEYIKTGDSIVLDAGLGRVYVNPPAKVKKEYFKQLKKIAKTAEELKSYQKHHSYFNDGTSVNIFANIELPEEIDLLKEISIDGIGLFRTEFLYIVKKRMLTEDEQFEIYKAAAEKLKDKPFIIRTYDAGGDKKISGAEESENPALGLRAIRYCLKHKDIFIAQLKAILRSADFGSIKILIPFVSSAEEMREVKKIIRGLKSKLNIKNKNISIGAMIEIPGAVFEIDEILKESDFISIGTNDMLQYLLAADRNNKDLTAYYNPYHPSLFKMIKILIDKAKIWNKPVYFCGEIVSDPCFFLIACGIGGRNFSMNLKYIPEIKKIVSKFSIEKCRSFGDKIMSFNSADKIAAYVKTVIYSKIKRFSPEIENIYLRYVKK